MFQNLFKNHRKTLAHKLLNKKMKKYFYNGKAISRSSQIIQHQQITEQKGEIL